MGRVKSRDVNECILGLPARIQRSTRTKEETTSMGKKWVYSIQLALRFVVNISMRKAWVEARRIKNRPRMRAKRTPLSCASPTNIRALQPLRDAYRHSCAAGQLICARGTAFPVAPAAAKHGEQVRADANANNNEPAATLIAAALTDATAGRLAKPSRDDSRAQRASHLRGARARGGGGAQAAAGAGAQGGCDDDARVRG